VELIGATEPPDLLHSMAFRRQRRHAQAVPPVTMVAPAEATRRPASSFCVGEVLTTTPRLAERDAAIARELNRLIEGQKGVLAPRLVDGPLPGIGSVVWALAPAL
jgi:hypothetical protein